jgi:LmbE family N-acetylglucosaminyl deacetylase
MIEDYPEIEVTWVVFGAQGERANEARQSADEFLARAREKKVEVYDFRDGYFPYIGGGIKDAFEQLKKEISPDLIFTHNRQDLHQDHRLLSELTWNTFRDHLILEYEIPKYDGDFGSPNCFVPLKEEICAQKVRCILDIFKTQAGRHWFTADTFWSVLRLRGIECGAAGKYAEAFYCRKMTLGERISQQGR